MGSMQPLEDTAVVSDMMDKLRISTKLAATVVGKFREGQASIKTGMLGRHQVKTTFIHPDATLMTPVEMQQLQCGQIARIGIFLGEEFLLKTPGFLLEQFTAMAGNRGIPDCGSMLHGLLHGFMIAYATKETEGRALRAILEIASLCNEANEVRGMAIGQAGDN